MSKILRRLLWWSGGATLLVVALPSLIVIASVALIVPGLVLAAMPTLFLYTVVFSVAWFGLRGTTAAVAAAVGVALVGTVAFVVPEILNTISAGRLAEAARRDRAPAEPLGRAGRIGLQAAGETWSAGICNDLCQLLLLNGGADEVVVLPRLDEATPAPRARNARNVPSAFRLTPAPACPDSEAIINGGGRQSWTRQATDIAKAARLRVAGGACLSANPAGDERPDLLIRRIEERIGTRPGRLALAPASVEIKALEIQVGDAVAARVSSSSASLLSVPLHLSPYGYGMSLDGWEWARNGRSHEPLDARAALEKLTTLALTVPSGAGGTELRARLDAALADPSLPAGHPALELVGDYFDLVRREGLKADDRERLTRLVGDDRVTRLWFFPYDAVRQSPDATLRDAILDRLVRLGPGSPGESYKALEQLTRAMPNGSFRDPDNRVETLLADVALRARSPNLIYRLADRGPIVAERLVAMMREGWTARPSDPKRRRDAGDGGASSALEALCQIAPDAAFVLPQLRALSADPVVPPRVLEGDLWRATLLRLGAGAAEFDKPANLSGTVEQYRERLQRRGCRT